MGCQVLIEIDGLVNLLPKSLHDIKQRTLALRDFEVGSDPATQSTRTVNGMINPQFSIAPGETQLWKLANIGSELFYNVILPGHVFYVIAENGMPVWRVWETDKLLLPSGKRYEVLVISRTNGTFPLTALSYQQGCVVCPQVTLATLNVEGPPVEKTTVPTSLIPKKALDGLPIANRRTLTFSSNDSASRYMIDNQVFDPQRVDVRVRLGDVEDWTLKNMDVDEHPFHIHVNDFQVMSVNGQPYEAPGLQDTVVLPGRGQVVIRIPFEDFAGKFVYHCHIMFHGDGGMMGVVEVVK
jgi:FtsP/CotA-like multicopper oxidase with cupredoxin domain